MTEKNVVLITGTPGVGKTHISKELSGNFFVVHLNEEVKKHELFIKNDIIDENAVLKHMRSLIDEKNSIIIFEGHFSHIYSPADKVIVFRCDPNELRNRLSKRKYNQEKIEENVEAEIMDVCIVEAIQKHGIEKVHEIQTDNTTIETIISDINEIIQNKKEMKPGKINFLENHFQKMKKN